MLDYDFSLFYDEADLSDVDTLTEITPEEWTEISGWDFQDVISLQRIEEEREEYFKIFSRR